MARTHNEITLLGNVGQDPEIRTTNSGKKVATLSVATSPPWNDNETNWHRVVGWEKVAEIIERYVSKGDMIFLTGRLRYNQWTDDAGNKRSTPEVIINNLTLLGRRSQQGDPVQATSAPDNVGQSDGDLPI